MPRIIYLCPSDNTPTGGIKVIYRQVEVLSSLGAGAFVLHPIDPAFRCTWFEAKVRFLDSLELNPETDFLVIPELWAAQFGPQCVQQNVRYAIFVQNGYMSRPVFENLAPAVIQAYGQAALVLVISDDTAEMVKLNYPKLNPARILRVTYSVHPRFLAMGPAATVSKTRTITYMPRKLPDHAWRVVFALGQYLPPGWTINSIQDVDEATCAAMLSASRIFLAFSSFEGLPLPPLEAAIAGNLVIGYTGQGAREYWTVPNFQEIHQGDIINFVKAAAEAAKKMDAGKLALSTLFQGAARLSKKFSPAVENASMGELLKRINECFA